mgnify:FL=1|jgi:hypothetical protein
MRAAISSTTYDPAGHVELDCLADTTHGETARRLNRVATLDGGAVFNDFGQSEADRTIELRWRPRSAADEARVERLVKLYSRLHLATARGVWLVAPERYVPGANESRLTLLCVAQMTNED